jgi:hypothetical protein
VNILVAVLLLLLVLTDQRISRISNYNSHPLDSVGGSNDNVQLLNSDVYIDYFTDAYMVTYSIIEFDN